jgi:hypothetical protein
MVLIALIMPVAMHCIALCTRLAGQSERQIEAAGLAKTMLTELVATEDWQNGDQGGDFGTDWPGYEWSATLADWTDSTVRQLDVTVYWVAQGANREITLSTLVYKTSN